MGAPMSIETLADLLFETIDRRAKPDAFLVPGEGGYRPISTERFANDVERTSLGLAAAGIEPGDRVAILSENRYEWAVADFAILTAGAVTVPIYATLPAGPIEFVLGHSRARAIFVSDRAQMAKLAETGARTTALEAIVLFGPDAAPSAGPPRVTTLERLMAEGEERRRRAPGEHRERAARIRPDDLATLVYTSGTSGTPKGVLLTHRNIVTNTEACLARFPITASDACFSFLPLSHVLERTGGQFAMVRAGATIAYAASIGRVPQNIAETGPTVLIAVPRFFEKTLQRIEETIRKSPPSRRRLYEWAKRIGQERAARVFSGRCVPWILEARYRLADRLVYRRVRSQFGGRIRFFVSGGAPLSREIVEFFFGLGMPVLEGYGLTESAPVLTANSLESPRPGTAGPPLDGVEIAIAEDGEILARGPNIMAGYFGDEEATRTAVVDGWLHTGDVGHFDERGYLVITDRKKDLIVTAGGKNIAPQPIEALLKMIPLVTEAIVVGDRQRFVAALLFPDVAALESWAAALGIHGSRAELARDERVRAHFRERIDRVNTGLPGYEQVRRFTIVPEELTLSDGDLTPTLKVKRSVVSKRYAAEIEAMYGRG